MMDASQDGVDERFVHTAPSWSVPALVDPSYFDIGDHDPAYGEEQQTSYGQERQEQAVTVFGTTSYLWNEDATYYPPGT